MGGRGGGLTNERPGSDHVIGGQMRGLEKSLFQLQTYVCTDMTDSAQRGQVGEKNIKLVLNCYVTFEMLQ